MEYTYPFSQHWTTEEVIDTVAFFQAIEKVYEKGILREDLLKAYRRFKEIVPGKADEKKLTDEFKDASGYSPYEAVQLMKQAAPGSVIQMKQRKSGR